MAVTRLHFSASLFGAAVTARVPLGERVMDACDAAGAGVPFSCRDASCGTCLVEVMRGAELLDAPRAEERVVLLMLGRLAPRRVDAERLQGQPAPPTREPAQRAAGAGAGARYRLACQAVVVAAGEVAMRLAVPAAD